MRVIGMAVLEIRKGGDPVLRRRCRPVRRISARVRQHLADMAETLYAARGVGLAASQVGLDERLVVLDVGEGLHKLINPEVVRTQGSSLGWEACLSFPGILGQVERAEQVWVRALDERGRLAWLEGSGILARALQHEIDHLDGVLFLDRARAVMTEEEYRALEEAAARAEGDEAAGAGGVPAGAPAGGGGGPPAPGLGLAFMGTPEFALPSLEAISGSAHRVLAVVTQPDRPRGRKGVPSPPPVKEWAQARGIRVLQPEDLEDAGFLGELRSLQPDVGVVVAYGRILPAAVLSLPRLGCINLHASLLPRYRGAAPIQWALINGERETGVTVAHLVRELDAGDIILQEPVAISPDDTAGSLGARLAKRGAELLVEALDLLAQGRAPRRPQDGSLASLAPSLGRSREEIRWDWPAARIDGLVRALAPSPGAFTTLGDRVLKVWKGRPLPGDGAEPGCGGPAPGTVTGVGPEGLVVAAGGGRYLVEELQLEGKRRMAAAEFLRGSPLRPGTVLGRSGEPRGD
ncbi:MAG: methionyl-tRNA formyltransferase [Acetobacteraceae bacterium]|nr:methionyl-tRNA formyltransferase [Acetobacteraceae bacterium]